MAEWSGSRIKVLALQYFSFRPLKKRWRLKWFNAWETMLFLNKEYFIRCSMSCISYTFDKLKIFPFCNEIINDCSNKSDGTLSKHEVIMHAAVLVSEQLNVGLEMFSSIHWLVCSIFCSSKTVEWGELRKAECGEYGLDYGEDGLNRKMVWVGTPLSL